MKFPVTLATRDLTQHAIPFTQHLYPYVEKGGTAVSSKALGVPEHQVIKTLVMTTETKEPLIILMHGDKQVSTKELARILAVKTVQPATPEQANKWTGYLVGGTSPFGTKRALPVYAEASIAELPQIFINGGKRGFLLGMAASDLIQYLKPTLVAVATD
jgi:Cys-tRNA(Pro) deacylase